MLEMGKTVGEIFETNQYDMFKRLEWNRAVTNARKEKIKRSIIKNGYIMSPVCVNEDYAVIDGQGRVEALKELEMPVHYYVVPGAGREECIAMNVNGTNWSVQDFIDSYANSGYEGYKRLVLLQDEFKKSGIMFKPYLFSIRGTCIDNDTLKSGHLNVSEDEYSDARLKLAKLQKYVPYLKHVDGNRSNLQIAILFVLGLEDVNEENLFARVQTSIRTLPPVGTIASALKALSDLYNAIIDGVI